MLLCLLEDWFLVLKCHNFIITRLTLLLVLFTGVVQSEVNSLWNGAVQNGKYSRSCLGKKLLNTFWEQAFFPHFLIIHRLTANKKSETFQMDEGWPKW